MACYWFPYTYFDLTEKANLVSLAINTYQLLTQDFCSFKVSWFHFNTMSAHWNATNREKHDESTSVILNKSRTAMLDASTVFAASNRGVQFSLKWYVWFRNRTRLRLNITITISDQNSTPLSSVTTLLHPLLFSMEILSKVLRHTMASFAFRVFREFHS